jgi:transposase InsO family protein
VNVSVRLTWTTYERGANNTEWVLDTKQLSPGVVVARSLLPKVDSRGLVRAINLSDQSCNLHAQHCIGTAWPAEVVGGASPDSAPRPQATPVDQCHNVTGDVSHIHPVLDKFSNKLSGGECTAAITLVENFADIFSRSEFDFGHTSLLPHRIETGEARPFKQQIRRHHIAHLGFFDDQVDKMRQAGVIEPCSSPWSSNVVLAKKSDGTLRFCVDYRKLNDLTYKDSFPLPRIDTCLDALGGSMYFSTMDLRSGFWQVAIDPRDADKTAFVTRKGQFRFNVLSFGLANSPSVFQRLMSMLLAGLHWDVCLVYIDDIIVMGRTFGEHMRNLAQVFQRLRFAGLKLKPTKCQLFQKKVSFLGHVVSSRGIEPDPSKVSCIVEWPEPKCLTEMRSFLGLASYYKHFVENFGEIARPLYELTRKGARFVWGDRCRQAFETLKARLSSAPVLATPIPEAEYVLDVDASTHGVGAILQQYQQDELRVIRYASRLFNTAEKSYCTTRQELAAIVFGLKRFRQYLLGQAVLVRSDHAALSYLRHTKDPVSQQARWLDFIEQFDIRIQHRSGSAHRAADVLSRRPREASTPCSQCARGSRSVEPGGENWGAAVCDDMQCLGVITRAQAKRHAGEALSQPVAPPLAPLALPHHTGQAPPKDSPPMQTPTVGVYNKGDNATSVNNGVGWTRKEMYQLQQTDGGIERLASWLSLQSRPPRDEIGSARADLKSYWAQWDSLRLVNGVVYRAYQRPDGTDKYLQLLIPRSIRQSFLEMVHGQASGHFGWRKTMNQVQRRAYWVSWRTNIKLFCMCCKACNQFHRCRLPKHAGLKPLFAGAPMECLHVDLTGPHVNCRGCHYIMTACCSFSRFVISSPLRDKTALSVARALVSDVILKFGAPQSILTDLGREFQNELWKELCRLLRVTRLRTTAYCPSTNGKIERWHRSLNAMMAKVVDAKQKAWVDFLPFVTAAYNATTHDSTSFTPNFILFGRELPSPVDIAFGCSLAAECSVNDYAQHIRERMAEAYALVRVHAGKFAEVNKRYYDARVKPIEFKVDDLVWYFCPRARPGTSPKWTRFYSGPYKVIRKINDVNYAIQLTTKSRVIIVHVN